MEPSVADRPSGASADSPDGTPARAAYQAELEQLRIQVELMGVRVDQNLERMRSVLHHGDEGEASLAIAADDEIDAMQVSLTERGPFLQGRLHRQSAAGQFLRRLLA